MNKIPMSCRDFKVGSTNERRRFAKEFVEEFVRGVAPNKRLKDSAKVWTDQIRSQFMKMCPEDCDTVPNKKEDWKEFLVDFTWMEKGQGGRVLLACESEWASDRFGTQTRWGLVEEDFEKLLAVKAPYKLLIFSSIPESLRTNSDPEVNFSIQHAKDRIAISLRKYWHHLSGETYMLLDFPGTGDKDGDGVYDAYIWIAENDGEAEIKFDDLAGGKLNRPLND
jgi:hypothetical protein